MQAGKRAAEMCRLITTDNNRFYLSYEKIVENFPSRHKHLATIRIYFAHDLHCSHESVREKMCSRFIAAR